MPKRTDIKSILILGAGPIVIGQACEFDYSGTQACKTLREEGYRVILVNSNPATIMTDPDMADATYIEPIDWTIVRNIIEKERPDAILATVGGQSALNCALDLEKNGVLNAFQVEMLGATADTIDKAENRQRFTHAMKKIGLETARSGIAHTLKEALDAAEKVGFPCVIRPSFTMGGTGGGIAYQRKELEAICERALDLSPTTELLIDEALIGWKEYEMEVIRDKNDNCIIVCSIENIDPMGIHTGDSITVAPAQTLTDKEYQTMRNSAIAILREIGVETGGSNVQFSVDPKRARLIIVEMNPRVSRSSALASKATGFPIAKVATKLAVGYTLDELTNDIASYAPAAFEPSLDYVVTKIPRFNFEKFPGTNNRLTTQMKSVGEVMAIGSTQQESLQKALRSLDVGANGFDPKLNLDEPDALMTLRRELKHAGSDRIWYVADAFRAGMSVDTIFNLTKIDRWFLAQIEDLIEMEKEVSTLDLSSLSKDYLRDLKRKGFSDARLATLIKTDEIEIRILRERYNLHPVYKRVDTCSAEFSTDTAYMYSTYYDDECESNPHHDCEKIMILGSGPNRIGQGIEFDYCCVQAALALHEDGYEIIMVNCNPETVSTDYDISDRLYFEPVSLEDILEIIRIENPTGVIVHYGGQTPLKLASELKKYGVPLIGTSPDAIDRAEDRNRFQQAIAHLGMKQPANASATKMDLAIKQAKLIGYPLILRPSYVLGGRAMEIIHDEVYLIRYLQNALSVSQQAPILLEKFIDDAVEVDVDAICDGKNVWIGGIMEHIDEAGVHSGDSACSLPVYTLSIDILNIIRQQVKTLGIELQIRGLMNVQFAVKNKEVYLIELNPRAARTVPFVSKATGVALAKVAARVMVGISLYEQGVLSEIIPPYYSVKEVLLPFNKFPGVDPLLSPEMRSTGEIMGVGNTFLEAFSKVIFTTTKRKIISRRVLLSMSRDDDKDRVINLTRMLIKQGFEIDVTHETAWILSWIKGVHHVDIIAIQNNIKHGEYGYIINTNEDSKLIRRSALQYNVRCDTTLNRAFATTRVLNIDATTHPIRSIQERHAQISADVTLEIG